jgi:5-(carboxyamino)imidazole ribonucleotide synthase
MKHISILPGSTIGCLGGGQLGRMFALAARKMGYRVHTVDPTPDSPTGQISDREYNTAFDDIPTLLEFAQGVDVVTYEFENIPIEALDALAAKVPLRPGRDVLYTTQNRRREKEFLRRSGFPVGPFRVVESEEDLRSAVSWMGFPCVLKTADFGYDGKGQQKISHESDLAAIWQRHGHLGCARASRGQHSVARAIHCFRHRLAAGCDRTSRR